MRSNRIVLFLVAALVAAGVSHLALCSACWAKSPAPRFMIMIEEKNLGTYTVDEAEKVITAYLMANGMEVVDAELIKTNVDRDKALQVMNASPRSAAAMGLQFGADVVLVGKAISKGSADQIKDTSFRSYQASVSLKAIRTDTAEILAMENREAAKIHVDDMAGGTLAIREAATPLIRCTFTSVYVHVNGIAHFFGFVNFFFIAVHAWALPGIQPRVRGAKGGVPGLCGGVGQSFRLTDTRCSGRKKTLRVR